MFTGEVICVFRITDEDWIEQLLTVENRQKRKGQTADFDMLKDMISLEMKMREMEEKQERMHNMHTTTIPPSMYESWRFVQSGFTLHL